MTINYNLSVSTSRPWTLFKLLLKWRGSIWRSVCVELLVWLILYAIISICYRFAMNDSQQRQFEVAIAYCDHGLSYIPLNFMLGFFVTAILTRWLTLFRSMGFIDNLALKIGLFVRGTSSEAVLYRRSCLRYCSLGQIMVFRDISMKARRRFPTVDSVVEAGYMLPHEKKAFDDEKCKFGKHWLIFHWAIHRLYEARTKGMIESDFYLVQIIDAIMPYRMSLSWLLAYDWVPIPLVYPQLICLAVHTFFLISLIARQYVIDPHATGHTQVDIYFPLMGALQFIFYMGWMKIAEVMLNPFGEDDDDFESNRLIDRNFNLGLAAADDAYGKAPALMKDKFYNKEEQAPLYSQEAARMPNYHLRESVSHVELPTSGQVKMVPHLDDLNEKEPLLTNLRERISSISVGNLFSRNRHMETQIVHRQVGRKSKRNSLPCSPTTAQMPTNAFDNNAFDEAEEGSQQTTICRPPSDAANLRQFLERNVDSLADSRSENAVYGVTNVNETENP